MRKLMLLAAMLAMVLVVAVPAFAQGKFEQGLDRSNSICAASGLNDEPDADFPEDGRTQSYGQLVKKGVAAPGDTPRPAEPGLFCNPTNEPPEE